MSHSTAAVKFPNGNIYYCEYNGTVDVLLPHLYKTAEERNINWRRSDWKHSCKCPNIQEVMIATSYGGGFSWNGKACEEHLVVTENLMPFDYNDDTEIERIDGLPAWYPFRDLYYGYKT